VPHGRRPLGRTFRALRPAAPDSAEADTGLDVFAAPADGGVPDFPPPDEQSDATAGRRRNGGMTALLEVQDLRTGYGILPVLQGLSFSVPQNETCVVFGLNGAGKTTTVNCIAGLLPTWGGRIMFEGRDISKLSPDKRVSAGLALSPEGRRVFPGLSVLTNLKLGAWTKGGRTGAVLDRVYSYFPRLAERRDQLAGTMSGGEQQMLAIGRAMMSEPRLLLVDEASLGLSPKLAQTVFQVVQQIAGDGTTVLIVEQNVGILPFADRALVMEKGTLTYDGTAAELERTGDLQKAYLG